MGHEFFFCIKYYCDILLHYLLRKYVLIMTIYYWLVKAQYVILINSYINIESKVKLGWDVNSMPISYFFAKRRVFRFSTPMPYQGWSISFDPLNF